MIYTLITVSGIVCGSSKTRRKTITMARAALLFASQNQLSADNII